MSQSSIVGVQFTLRGTEDIIKNSAVQVSTFYEYTNNLPAPLGVRDLKMGTTLRKIACPTCGNTKGKCLGHNGHLVMRYPVINPFGFAKYKKWLKVVCHRCGGPVVEPPASATDRLAAAASATRDKNRICSHCSAVHPILKPDDREKMCLMAYIYDDASKGKIIEASYPIYPHMAQEIFSRVTQETVAFYRGVGATVLEHPSNTVLSAVTVPSNVIRPDVRQTGDDKMMTKSITNLIIVKVRANDKFPDNYREIMNDALAKKIWELNNMYFEMCRASGKESMSIVGSFKGKVGLFRGNILGKRSRDIVRSTIVGDPSLRIDEIRIPQKFARTIQINITLQDYNRDELMVFLQNGPRRYPGASTVTKKNGGVFDVSDGIDFSTLEAGDIVSRDLIDGDYVYFNRQPSLMPSSIAGFRTYVARDPSDNTIGMPPAVCPLFGADFDGDQMNILMAVTPATMVEIELLGWMGNQFIHFSTAKCLIGQSEDSVVGLAELTRNQARLDKYHANLVLSNVIRMPNLTDLFGGEPTISGRDCVSVTMAETPIDLTRQANWYNSIFIPAVRYDPGEITTTIKRGKLVSGILDKKTIGRGAEGSLYQIIANDHGNRKAIECLFDMLQVSTQFMKLRGYTIGLKDVVVSPSAREQIKNITGDTVTRSELIIDQLVRGDIVPPMGITVAEHYETMQLAALKVYDGYIDVLLENIDPDTNNLFKLAAYGSKGSINNVANISSAVGQKVLDGKRVPKKFGYGRTLPYFQRYDLSPVANGFVASSYINGINPAEMVFAGMCSRWALIIKALASSVSGAMGREAKLCMESLMVNYFRHISQFDQTISFSVGDDNLNPQKIEPIAIRTVMLSDADFRDKYENADFPEEFTAMSADRQKYRDIFLRLESTTVNEPFKGTRQLAVNIPRIIDGVLGASGGPRAGDTATRKDLAECARMVAEFCEGLPYVYYNEYWQRAKRPTSKVSQRVVWLTCMQARSCLCSREVARLGISLEQLSLILSRVQLMYSRALVEPGTTVGLLAAMGFSEPNMQSMMDAHRQSASGGNSLSGTKRAKEVFHIKETADMAAPEMILQFIPEIASDKSKVQRIANDLEVMKFSTFISGQALIFVETYGVPVHPGYAAEVALIKSFEAKNPLMKPPGNLLHFCIRYELDKTQLILKNMEIEHIATRLRAANNNLFVVYTPKNSARVILRVYIRGDQFKDEAGKLELEALDRSLREVILRGMPGIVRATPIKLVRHEVDPSGAVVPDANRWGIQTVGTNLVAGLTVEGLMPTLIFSNSIREINDMFGIEAARSALINECRRMLPECNHRHYATYAATITQKGYPTSINKTGTKTREINNVMLNMGYSNPTEALDTAIDNNVYNPVYGVTAALSLGATPEVGSNYTKLQVSAHFVEKNSASINREFDELFDM